MFVAIIGLAAQSPATNALDDSLVFPGKATWGFSKDVFGPISISIGPPKRKERSVFKAATIRQDGREEKFAPNEDLVHWEGRALPLVTERDATVVSASISITGGEDETEDQGDHENTRPIVPRLRPSFPPRQQPAFPWFRWRRRRPNYTSQQFSKGRLQNIGGKYEILQAGIKGDSPFVYTRSLRSPSPAQSSRSARFYEIKEEVPQNVHDQSVTKEDQQHISEDDGKEEEGTKCMSVQQCVASVGDAESMTQEEKQLVEDSQESFNSSGQKILSVEKRQVDSTVSSKDTQHLQGSSDSGLQTNETLPEDKGVKTTIYVNMSDEDKFHVYFEEERTNASYFSSSQQQDGPNGQSSSKYSNLPPPLSRPTYIVVKESPQHHLPEDANEVDSPDAVPRYRVQKVPGRDTTKQTLENPNSEVLVTTRANFEDNPSSTTMTESKDESFSTSSSAPVNRETQSKNNHDSTTANPTRPKGSFIFSSTYNSEESMPEPPEEEVNEIYNAGLTEQSGNRGRETHNRHENKKQDGFEDEHGQQVRGLNGEQHNSSDTKNQNVVPTEQEEKSSHFEEEQNNVYTKKRLPESVIDSSRNLVPERKAPVLPWNPLNIGTPYYTSTPTPSWTPDTLSSTQSAVHHHTPHQSHLWRDSFEGHPKALALSIGEGHQDSSGSVRVAPLALGCVLSLLVVCSIFY